jgi:translation initiation factor 2 subunit 2
MEFDYEKLLEEAMKKIPQKALAEERFKIPSVTIEIQGNKTLIKNFGEILSVLRRSSSHLSKYLLKELATPGSVQENVLILQRIVPKEILQKKIESYVKEFVLCKVCNKPDTKLVKEDRLFLIKCDACGAKSPVRTI